MPWGDTLSQTSRTFVVQNGFSLPVMPARAGKSINVAVSTAASPETAVTLDGCDRIVRIFAIGAPVYYKFGATGMSVPGAADCYVPADQFKEDVMFADTNFVRFITPSGTGTARIEVLG